MESKVCTKCGLDLPLDEFYKNSGGKGGKTAACKTCIKADVRRRAGRNEELRKERRKAIAEAGAYVKLAEKWCTRGKHMVPIDGFHNDRGSIDGKQQWCKECQAQRQREDRENRAAYQRAWKARNPELHQQKARDYHLMRRFKMTQRDFDDMLEKQGFACAACGNSDPHGANWHIDHDHACCDGYATCGECVQAILCNPCNTTIGRFNDNPELLYKLAEYIIKTRENTPEMETPCPSIALWKPSA